MLLNGIRLIDKIVLPLSTHSLIHNSAYAIKQRIGFVRKACWNFFRKTLRLRYMSTVFLGCKDKEVYAFRLRFEPRSFQLIGIRALAPK